jgi:hypothetical protein
VEHPGEGNGAELEVDAGALATVAGVVPDEDDEQPDAMASAAIPSAVTALARGAGHQRVSGPGMHGSEAHRWLRVEPARGQSEIAGWWSGGPISRRRW